MNVRIVAGVIVSATITAAAAAVTSVATAGPQSGSFRINVLVLQYFPMNGSNLDIRVTGDAGGSLEMIRDKTRRQTQDVIRALEEGSRYRAFADSNAPATLKYEVVGTREFLEPLPTWKKSGHKTPMTDYRRILNRVNIEDWVEVKDVKEVWIWGYHGGKVDLWASSTFVVGDQP